ncbi:MAG TPA: transglycosylase domain-containing protein [Anaeromyxobacteraceae bacterium]|jgi:hypothetical protein|nr:transglycosylase domain-containing protein [Anaeromyxobacteraceae bacterium]
MSAGEPAPPQPRPSPQPRRATPGRGAARGALAALALALLAGVAALGARAGVAHARAALVARLRARVPAARLGAVGLDWRLRLTFRELTIPDASPGQPPLLTVEKVAVRVAWLPLLAGRAEPAAVLLDGVTVEAGLRGEALSRLAERLRGPARTAPDGGRRAPPVVRVQRARLRLLLPGPGGAPELVQLGPAEGTLRVQGAGAARTAVARASWGDGAHAELELGLAAARPVRLHLAGVALAGLPPALARRLPFQLRGGFLSLELHASNAQPSSGQARLMVDVREATVAGPALGPEPLGPLTAGLRGVVAWDAGAQAVLLREAELTLGADGRARVALDASLALRPEPRFGLELKADALSWEDLLAALPQALRPGDEAPRVTGALAGHLALSGPLRGAERWRLDAALDLSGLDGDRRSFLARSFHYRPIAADGVARDLLVGPEDPRFVPLSALPPHLVRAVTTAEDAAFWGHRGFDFDELRNAFAEGVDAGRLGRGASTITQQLAKNLFLTPERTLARKAREALVTVALEASLPKARLLEIYLNVAEWGPGIYGIGAAARHYFAKDPRELTPKEAAFLASIIPNPVRYHMYYARGGLTEAWEARVRELLQKLRSVDAIDDAQLQEALAVPLAFARG